MTLGNAAAARVRLIVWCKGCQHQVEPDPGEMAARYGADTPVPREPQREHVGERNQAAEAARVISSYEWRDEAETADQRTIKRRLQRGYTSVRVHHEGDCSLAQD